MSNGTPVAHGLQVKYVSVEGTLNKLADGLLIDEFVRELTLIQLWTQTAQPAVVHSPADILWLNDYRRLFTNIFGHNLGEKLCFQLNSW